MARAPRIPSYRLHKPSGRAVVTLNGKDQYLGAYGSEESKSEYQRVVGEWLAGSQTSLDPNDGDPVPLAEVMVAYVQHADTYYRDALGGPTGEVTNVRYALLPLEALYARTQTNEFGPLQLKAVREKMIADGLSRGVIN